MDVVCEVCGDVGYKYLLVQCNSCQNAARHRYCFDRVIYNGSSIKWFCDDCLPKHNEVVEPFKERHDDPHSIQLGSMTNEPNVNRVVVTKELRPWGRHRCRSHMARSYSNWGRRKLRSHKARRDSTDACTKCGDTFNLSKMFFEEKSKHNDVFKEREGENYHFIYHTENADGSSHLASDLAAETQKKPAVNTIGCLDLPSEKDSRSFSLIYVEGSIPQGTKTDLLPLINCIETSHPFVTDDFCHILSIAEQEVGSHALGSAEQPHPLELVNPDGSNHSPLDPALEIEKQGILAGLFASVNDVEQYCPFSTDKVSPTLSSEEQVGGSSPMSESWEQPHPLEVVKPCYDVPKGILESESPTYSQQMQGSDPHDGNMDVLDPFNECLDSRSMSKNVDLSSSSGGDGNSAVEKDNAERTECLSGTETVTPVLDNVQGSRPSAEPLSFSNGDSAIKEDSERTERLSGTEPAAPALDNVLGSSSLTTQGCLVPNVDNSDEANRSDNHLLCTVENKELGQLSVLSYPSMSSVEVQFSHNDFNEASNPKPTLKGKNPQNDVQKTSVSAGKNGFHRHLQNDANGEALPSKHDPCKATKSSFEKQHNGLNSSPHVTKHQKTKFIRKDRNYPAHLKRCSPSEQLDRTCLSASSELSSKTNEINDANDAEPRCPSSVPTSMNSVPKKRKRLILRYDKDAEAMRLKDSNPPSSENDGQVKMHRRCVESVAMKQKRSAESYEEALCPGNSTNQHVNDKQAKKQRRANEDKKAHLGNFSVPCTQNDATQLASEAVVVEGQCSLTRTPAVSAPTDQQHFICTQPTDRPYWTGIMKIGQEYISLAAHLSNQACKEVQELSRSLPPVMKVTKHSKLKAWPKRWEASEPIAESIGLYFFPDDMRPNKDLDRLVQHVTDHNIVLKYAFSSAKLLIFPSILLPEQCQMFQGKHYLWGVFKRRMDSKAGTPVKNKACASNTVEKGRGVAR